MRVLVACEESQAVTIELRKLGHEAYSCDIIDCSGGHPEWHIVPRSPTQKIQPWQFGDPYEKTTCLWLKGLQPLSETKVVTPEARHITSGGKSLPAWYSNSSIRMPGNRQTVRSKTFPGIAKAMAEQWAGPINNKEE